MHRSPPILGERHGLGVLLVGGDWACAHGDLAGLAEVARQLVARTQGTTREDAFALARLCVSNNDHAVTRWVELRDRLHERTTSAHGDTNVTR